MDMSSFTVNFIPEYYLEIFLFLISCYFFSLVFSQKRNRINILGINIVIIVVTFLLMGYIGNRVDNLGLSGISLFFWIAVLIFIINLASIALLIIFKNKKIKGSVPNELD